ncbi:hypothetical protein AB4077_20260 [Vibrio cyclitrophicus]|uniref:hypothetical protein n=1 Tax=Vibrio cyclitrophicus TaxID=47951 RepID=UPI000C823B20|nr:hypothetical protein [Vibrio cyclitrophicus]MCC4775411.1 hypothetical protein [Vibrio cyclitrophicus]MCC4843929.1 hypothetical protein [Vibrio cyclitrophicus]PME11491.1 hypothetical protein BCV42_21100 [Vibrio cyclitrophicus]PME50437.1 hypothetical protein BCV37_11960 [Vibrio cyclitrophicus]PME78770.1 hypothetical protein BCV28_05605 [Vibrio cyclitrophicus]
MKFSLISLLVTGTTLSWSSYGYELDKQKEALNLIVTTAKELCENVPLSGGTEGVQLTGEAKAKVSGIVKKLADLGLEGAVKYESNEYEGVLQEDLAAIVNKSANCKMDVWKDLQDKLVLPPEPTSSTKNSEALIKDQNPTDIEIQSIELKEYWGIDEPYVVAVVKNGSTVSAKNVTATFWKGTDQEIISKDSIHKQYHISNLIIRSGAVHDFPIAPLSKYVQEISESSSPEDLVDFTVSNEDKLPFALQEKLCGKLENQSCRFDSFTKGTFVQFKYDTIFDDRVTKTTSFSNTFLDGDVRVY